MAASSGSEGPARQMPEIVSTSKRAAASDDEPATFDCSESSRESDQPGDQVQIIVGPSEHAFRPKPFRAIKLPAIKVPDRADDSPSTSTPSTELTARSSVQEFSELESRPGRLSLLDILRLSRARQEAPASFGSAQHLSGEVANCRTCIFERFPGRCRKRWLCDFCHLHQWHKRPPPVNPPLPSSEMMASRLEAQTKLVDRALQAKEGEFLGNVPFSF